MFWNTYLIIFLCLILWILRFISGYFITKIKTKKKHKYNYPIMIKNNEYKKIIKINLKDYIKKYFKNLNFKR